MLAEVVPGRWERLPEGVGRMLTGIRDASWSCRQALGPDREKGGRDDDATARKFALALVEEVHDVAGRLLTAFDREDPATRPDVVWCSETRAQLHADARAARRAALGGGAAREPAVRAFDGGADLGDARARRARSTRWRGSGVCRPGGPAKIKEPIPDDGSGHDPTQHADRDPATNLVWHGLDVGSPFAHGKAGILYVARHLPPPGRDGLSPACLDEIEALVRAAGGRALGLFSSMRAAKQAAEDLRTRWDGTVLCQGDDATGTLVTKFAADVESVLFGTLSLWQGVDVPGESLQLVMIDRIPFPRPDDPLVSARQRAVDARGGNGFLTVSATHAALLLAQGAGRLLRGTGDRGVVALLDSRVATKQYGGFLRGSLPPFWSTQDPAVVRGALERLRGA